MLSVLARDKTRRRDDSAPAARWFERRKEGREGDATHDEGRRDVSAGSGDPAAEGVRVDRGGRNHGEFRRSG